MQVTAYKIHFAKREGRKLNKVGRLRKKIILQMLQLKI
jgi:hypothetical protein